MNKNNFIEILQIIAIILIIISSIRFYIVTEEQHDLNIEMKISNKKFIESIREVEKVYQKTLEELVNCTE